jgi:N4-gp56 family major capsid protein
MALTISATDTEVVKPVNVAYEQRLLRNARPLCPHFLGSDPGRLNKNAGTATIKWRRYNAEDDDASGIDLSVTALAELTGDAIYGMGRTPDVVHFTDYTAPVSKYGQFYILNEEVDVFLPNGTFNGIVDTLAIACGRSMNALQRDVVEDGSTLIYAGGVASDGLVAASLGVAELDQAINTLVKKSAMSFTPMSGGSPNTGTTPILPGLWAITHPDVAYDIAKLTSGFQGVQNYASQTETIPGEIGIYQGAGQAVRVVQTPESSITLNAGITVGTSVDLNTSATKANLYTTVIFGQNAHGSVGLGESFSDGIYRAGDERGVMNLIVKGVANPSRASGTDDPFDEITTVAYKFWHGGKVTNANWIRGIRSGATNLAN